jgi:hypothetical protein
MEIPGWAMPLVWYSTLLVRKWPVALVLVMMGDGQGGNWLHSRLF